MTAWLTKFCKRKEKFEPLPSASSIIWLVCVIQKEVATYLTTWWCTSKSWRGWLRCGFLLRPADSCSTSIRFQAFNKHGIWLLLEWRLHHALSGADQFLNQWIVVSCLKSINPIQIPQLNNTWWHKNNTINIQYSYSNNHHQCHLNLYNYSATNTSGPRTRS